MSAVFETKEVLKKLPSLWKNAKNGYPVLGPDINESN
jgi:hypothetical protein